MLSEKSLNNFALKTFGENPSSDFEQIEKYLKPDDSILEIGAGTGRIGIELIKKGFSYTGIDRQRDFLDIFADKLKRHTTYTKNAQLLHVSFEEFASDSTFDVILFSWSVIWDFPKEQQMEALTKAHDLLFEDGICLIENPSRNQKFNTVDYHEPTPFFYDEWTDIFNMLAFSHTSNIYKTKTGVERELTILKRKVGN